MTTTDTDLYERGAATAIASWQAYAEHTDRGALRRFAGAAVAVFPDEPERSIYNNAIISPQLTAPGRTAAIDIVEAVYAAAGVDRYATWVHEQDDGLRADLEQRGYVVAESTRAMTAALDELDTHRPTLDVTPLAWFEYLRAFDLAPDLLGGGDRLDGFHLIGARIDGEVVGAAMAFDHGTDCGIFNVGTVPHARRLGLGTALTTIALHDARDRGCATASLQSTPMAERVYAAVGFRDLGRILEYAPAMSHHRTGHR